MKPTAVEFAVEQLEQLIPFGHQLAVRIILEQAKEIEKQQIIDFTQDYVFECVSCSYSGETVNLKEAEQYYNETFKNK